MSILIDVQDFCFVHFMSNVYRFRTTCGSFVIFWNIKLLIIKELLIQLPDSTVGLHFPFLLALPGSSHVFQILGWVLIVNDWICSLFSLNCLDAYWWIALQWLTSRLRLHRRKLKLTLMVLITWPMNILQFSYLGQNIIISFLVRGLVSSNCLPSVMKMY